MEARQHISKPCYGPDALKFLFEAFDEHGRTLRRILAATRWGPGRRPEACRHHTGLPRRSGADQEHCTQDRSPRSLNSGELKLGWAQDSKYALRVLIVIAFVTQKGGVGKSTLAKALAAAARVRRMKGQTRHLDPLQRTWDDARQRNNASPANNGARRGERNHTGAASVCIW
jgi:hypothetical protein